MIVAGPLYPRASSLNKYVAPVSLHTAIRSFCVFFFEADREYLFRAGGELVVVLVRI